MTSRRGFLIGIGAALAAPAIVKAESLMKIAVLRQEFNERTLIEVLMAYQGERLTLPGRHYLFNGITWVMIDADAVGIKAVTPELEDVYAQAP